MRRFLIIVIVVVVVVAAVLVTMVIITNRRISSQYKETDALDSTKYTLPADAKAAQKTLREARAALAKFRPTGKYVVINTHANRLSWRSEDSVFYTWTCSTGTGGELIDSVTHRKWVFDTPRGVFKVSSKIKEPWWRKPDWAYIQEDEKIPKNESERYDPEMMGEYAIGFGDGYFIHGTIYERLLGISVTHGCVRLGSEDLEILWSLAKYGTYVYIF
ncbi:MAG: L,D-transpeptidase [candidate division Zixibacteria bacterium]|nr:L,D-transpeptidase [candidate division Zixibacteria bacterium]